MPAQLIIEPSAGLPGPGGLLTPQYRRISTSLPLAQLVSVTEHPVARLPWVRLVGNDVGSAIGLATTLLLKPCTPGTTVVGNCPPATSWKPACTAMRSIRLAAKRAFSRSWVLASVLV